MLQKLEDKWKTLPKGVQVLLIFVFLVIVGTFLFSSGKNIGEVVYHAIS